MKDNNFAISNKAAPPFLKVHCPHPMATASNWGPGGVGGRGIWSYFESAVLWQNIYGTT